MMWDTKTHFPLPLRRTFYWSAMGHAGLLGLLLVIGVLPAPHRRARIGIAAMTVTIHALPTISNKPEPKGEKRELEVENAVAPKPKPTPAPAPKPTPAPAKEIERPTVKEKVAMKEVKATPTPEPKKAKEASAAPLKEVKATPTPGQPSKSQGESMQIADSIPTIDSDPSSSEFDNRPAAKGSPDGTDAPGGSPMEIEGDVVLPPGYVTDAVARLRMNFVYPKSIDTRLSAPVTCIVEFRINNNGTVSDVKVTECPGHSNLERYAYNAVINARALLPLAQYTQRPYITARVPFTFGADLQAAR